MDCPGCHDAMIVLEWEQVEVDHCLSCKGVWLDRGELELLLEPGREQINIVSSSKTAVKQGKPRKCPICFKKMELITCGPGAQVGIDRCPKNDGFWFDAGELDAILRAGLFADQSQAASWLKDVFLKSQTR